MPLILVVLAATTAALAREHCASGSPERCGLGTELQLEGAASQEAALELLQRKTDHKHVQKALAQGQQGQLPDFSDIINSAQEAASSVADSVKQQVDEAVSNATAQAKEAMGDLKEQAQAMTSQAEQLAGGATTEAALMAAQTVNSTLLALGTQADGFLQACEQAKQEQLKNMQAAKAEASERLAALEAQAAAAVDKVLPLWANISSSATAAASFAASALSALGDESLGEELMSAVNGTLEHADRLTAALQNVSGLTAGLSSLADEEIMPRLKTLNDTLDSGLTEVEAYAGALTGAFDRFTDKAAAKLSSALPGVNSSAVAAAFASVDDTARAVVAGIAQGPRELLSGVGEAEGLTEQALPDAIRATRSVASGHFGVAAAALLPILFLGLAGAAEGLADVRLA